MNAGGELLLRRGILLLVASAVVTAVVGGLARLGIAVGPDALLRHAMEHGPLFVLGVFSTVISLERAVALGAAWSYAAPFLGAAGVFALLAAIPGAPWIAVGLALALVLVNVAMVMRQSLPFTWLMLLGSLVLAWANLVLARGAAVHVVAPAWMTFFVLTIVAERLELSRLAPTPQWASRLLVAVSAALAIAACAMTTGGAAAAVATPLVGAGFALLGLWQLRFDLARRTVRLAGLPRFAASGVLLGALWLLVAGVLLLGLGLPPAGPHYDAVLHSVFVGFVLSMVFAHAPIILPAVARVEVPFHPVLYVPLSVLHLGLVARVAGDLEGDLWCRQAGGSANALALVLFLAAVLLSRSRRKAPAGRR